MAASDALFPHDQTSESKDFVHARALRANAQPVLEAVGLCKPLGEPRRLGPRLADILLYAKILKLRSRFQVA